MIYSQDIFIDGNSLTVKDLVTVAKSKDKQVRLLPSAVDRINLSRKWVERAVDEGRIVYGITTGFGSFKNKFISKDEVKELQINIVRSHASGVGNPLSEETVRAIMLLRANSLAKGFSGVRLLLIEKILELLNKGVYPYIPEQGSVGSSGDLAPLCHMSLVLIGEGECLVGGRRVPSKVVLDENGIEPLELASKEGLGLSNGTSVQTAILALALNSAMSLVDSADFIAAMSVEVLMGSKTPFHRLINIHRNQVGQRQCAENIWEILKNSPIVDSHEGCDRVQDSYSLRCIPQVHGASRDSVVHVKQILERELNAATDNPLIFPDEDVCFSGGNFHGEPIAQAADLLKIAMSEIANISERRIAKMVDPANNEGLPSYLIDEKQGGLHSGLMIPQYTAASIVSENKILSHPASVDSIPTSANQEDHVSMGTVAARNAATVVGNVRNVLAIELLNNSQAYEFRKSCALSLATGTLYSEVRKMVAPLSGDRVLYRDIETLSQFLADGKLVDILKKLGVGWNFV